jgi:hypothetical protein
MDNVDSIKSIFTTYKQQLLFLNKRRTLFNTTLPSNNDKENDILEACAAPNSPAYSSPDPPLIGQTAPEKMQVSSSSHVQMPLVDVTTNQSIPPHMDTDTTSKSTAQLPLPNDYPIPTLPSSLLKDIENGDMLKFNPHCKNRQILIDAIFHDLTTSYNIW